MPETFHTSLDTLADEAFATFTQRASEIGLDLSLLERNSGKIKHAFTYSDFLSRIAHQYCKDVRALLPELTRDNIPSKTITLEDYDFSHVASQIAHKLTHSSSEAEAYAAIRQCRHLQMFKIAWFDFHKMQNIETSLLATSHLANLLIQAGYTYTYNQLRQRYGYPEQKQQLLILAMGKLGGNELNFSSDIDLIFVYPSNGKCDGKKETEHQVFFTKVAQNLIKMLDHITQDGRVYRVDMRLRPLGESGPLVLSFGAFESYYLEQGRQWERFAMQKMRIVNETPHNKLLRDIIAPFIYRKYIDFTTIDAIREMKQLIEKEVRRRQIKNNIKLGKGGIREVEFFVQSMQLIHAGRALNCQVQSILQAMQKLVDNDLLLPSEQQQIRQDYLFLRQVEHYIQAFNDEQTQTLPDNAPNQQRLCLLLSCDSPQEYEIKITQCMQRINEVFSDLISDANQQSSEQSCDAANSLYEDIWHIPLNLSELQQACQSVLNEASSELLWGSITHFRKRIERSGVSARALKSINRLMPLVIEEFEVSNKQLNVDQLNGLFSILQTISGRVTYIDLLLEYPDVRTRLYTLCKQSPWISQQIAQYPLLLDELLHPLYLSDQAMPLDKWKEDCTSQLRQSMLRVDLDDVEAIMDNLREFKQTKQLRIAAADISGTLAINQVSDRLTLLAEVIMQDVIKFAWHQVCHLFGQPTGNDAAIQNLALIAYGKFGGIELSYGSDLDIVFLHSADMQKSTDTSGTRKQISNQEFYIKLVQRICHLCATKTYNGILYEIDLRLRPSGNSGLLVSHINSFAEYQNNKAWTWEHQALVRSRIVHGNKTLQQRFDTIRNNIISRHRDKQVLKETVVEMRNKMRTHLHSSKHDKFDIKQAVGGIVDLEFMVQYWVLAHAHKHPELLRWSDNLRLLETLQYTHIIDAEKAKCLSQAYLTIRHTSHRLQLANMQYATLNDELEIAMMHVRDMYTETFP